MAVICPGVIRTAMNRTPGGRVRAVGILRWALVTGATGVIGEGIARGIASRMDFLVALACRDERRGEAVAARIREASGNDEVHLEQGDLASRRSIDALRERWDRPLHLLVNCAAVAPRRRQVSAEGVELQLAVNVLAYLRMIDRFADCMSGAVDARVVNVASYWAGDLDLSDLEFTRRRYDNNTAYRQSKQANRMLTVADARRLAAVEIKVNACHPGDANSALSNSLGFGGHESSDEAAATPLRVALDPTLGDRTGAYFEHGEERPDRFARDLVAIAALEAACRAYG
jgi:NAD(P)-dependent dehydrogenase (short-subunit alcohol dehydrogenase family)